MDYREQQEKQRITNWLNTPVDENNIIFDCVLDIRNDILSEIYSNKLTLRYDKETLLINLVYFLYYNSFTKII